MHDVEKRLNEGKTLLHVCEYPESAPVALIEGAKSHT